MRLRSLLLAGLAASIVPASAWAQEVAVPKREFTVEPGPALDTTRLNPQIDLTRRTRPEKPENPVVFLWDKADPNNKLKAGSVTNEPRVSLGPKFPGIGATGFVPPDPDLAVGKNHAVMVVNSSIGFFRKSDGGRTFQQTSETFFSGLGATSFQFDPKVVYDPISDRFFILFLEVDFGNSISKSLIAVSDDGDPNGTWYRYRVESKLTVGSNSYWLDYPGFGVSRDLVGFSGNMFGFTSGYQGNQYVILNKAAMLTGASVTATSFSDPSSSSVKIAAAADVNGLYGISVSAQDQLKVQHVTTSGVQSRSLSVPVMYPPSSDVPGPGGVRLDSLDGRLYNAQWSNGSLVTAHAVRTTQNDPTLVSRWYDVSLNGWPVSGNVPTLRQSGNVAGGSGTYYHMPAVMKNRSGSMAIVFTKTNSTILADLMVSARKNTDAPGTMGAPKLVRSSTGTYQNFRWGDYFQMTLDPSSSSLFWGVGMVAKNGDWDTEFFSLKVVGYENTTRRNVTAMSVLPRQGTLLDTSTARVDLVDGITARVSSSFVSGVGHVTSLVTDYASGLTKANVGALRTNLVANAPSNATVFGYLWNYDTATWDLVFTQPGGASAYSAQRIEDAARPYVSPTGGVRILTRVVRPNRTGSGPYTLAVDQQALFVAPRE